MVSQHDKFLSSCKEIDELELCLEESLSGTSHLIPTITRGDNKIISNYFDTTDGRLKEYDFDRLAWYCRGETLVPRLFAMKFANAKFWCGKSFVWYFSLMHNFPGISWIFRERPFNIWWGGRVGWKYFFLDFFSPGTWPCSTFFWDFCWRFEIYKKLIGF